MDWQNQFQDSCAGVALLVDDLDALEVLAPTPSAARRFMARSIELLSPTESHAGLHQLVTFGRHPLESVVELGGLDSSSGASVALAAAAVGNGAAAGNGLGLLNGRMPLSEVDQEPALCEYLRYR